jgi:hypothetical protein
MLKAVPAAAKRFDVLDFKKFFLAVLGLELMAYTLSHSTSPFL